MASRIAGTIAAVSAMANALLIPSGVQGVELEALEKASIAPTTDWQAIKLPCAECVMTSINAPETTIESDEEQPVWIQGGATSVFLNFTTLLDNKAVGINGFPLYPRLDPSALTTVDIIQSDASILDVADNKVSKQSATVDAATFFIHQEETWPGESIVVLGYHAIALDDHPVTLDMVEITCYQDANGNLAILDVAAKPEVRKHHSKPRIGGIREGKHDGQRKQEHKNEADETPERKHHKGPHGEKHHEGHHSEKHHEGHHGQSRHHNSTHHEGHHRNGTHHEGHRHRFGHKGHHMSACSMPAPLCRIRHAFEAFKFQLFHMYMNMKSTIAHTRGKSCGGKAQHVAGHRRPEFAAEIREGQRRHHGSHHGDHEVRPMTEGGKQFHHHHHHRQHRSGLSKLIHGFVSILVPVAMGMSMGILVSIVGLAVGRFVVFVWRSLFRRNQTGYLRLTDDDLEFVSEKGEIFEVEGDNEAVEPLPRYSGEAPAYEEKA